MGNTTKLVHSSQQGIVSTDIWRMYQIWPRVWICANLYDIFTRNYNCKLTFSFYMPWKCTLGDTIFTKKFGSTLIIKKDITGFVLSPTDVVYINLHRKSETKCFLWWTNLQHLECHLLGSVYQAYCLCVSPLFGSYWRKTEIIGPLLLFINLHQKSHV